MSFRAFSPLRSRALLHLTPSFRVHLHQQNSRSFHATPRRHMPEILNPMNWPHELLVGLHSSGLTWATIIPLTALLVRLNVAAFLTYPSRVTILRQLALKPILQARFRTNEAVGKLKSLDKNTQLRAVLTATRQMYKKWGCANLNKWLPLLQLPVFVSFMETIRAIGGSPVGFFGAIKQLLMPHHHPAAGGAEADARVDIAASSQIASSEATSLQTAPSQDQLHPEAAEMSALQPWFEPSFAMEGLSWCPDLTVPDPTGILPVAVPLMMLATIANSLYGAGGLKKRSPSRAASLLFRLSIVFTASIAWVAPFMPAGLLYYWMCSSTFAFLSQLFFDWRYPIKAIAPAKGKLPPRKK